MAKLRITRTDGIVSDHSITPSVEYSFEIYKGMGFAKAFQSEQKQTDLFWLAWECLRKMPNGPTVKLFGSEFVDTLVKVEVLDDDDPKA